ncbi:MAG: hypothetical protein E5V58_22645 [Mesorhizobium sp.]|uniref:hypothetical protein n=1 Tax=unclassified Mesorhizobium TaxID=325217 RepID=UPI000FE3B576|nr:MULTISPECIES: hypothetical protein [unclassified Mesorhizobium]RWC94076.1 MAG: hypothetical protein EOS32_18755 [Mesorhizobium sp.]RWX65580.1 hypothetical protein EN780_17605 [Mesorhizobium sp. M4B.F.Ca.ET.089.01.1.1]TIW70450.1 MAG: hypothetical protein E5V58_22645 [Mesorhizobium sp.]
MSDSPPISVRNVAKRLGGFVVLVDWLGRIWRGRRAERRQNGPRLSLARLPYLAQTGPRLIFKENVPVQ